MSVKNEVKLASEEIRPSSFLDYRDYLRTLYTRVKRQSEGYSYLKFAADLGFSATNIINQIVQGRRILSVKAAEKVIAALGLKGTERRYFILLLKYNNSRSPSAREELFAELVELKKQVVPVELDRDALGFFSEWYHPIIREMVGMPEFNSDAEWIADKLIPPIRPEQVRKSLELLEKLGLIRYDDEAKRHVQTQSNISTGHETRGIAIARYHQKMIEIGRESITTVMAERRDISAVTVRVSEAVAMKLKSMIHGFQMQLLEEAEKCTDGDQVFQANIQFFPFTKANKG